MCNFGWFWKETVTSSGGILETNQDHSSTFFFVINATPPTGKGQTQLPLLDWSKHLCLRTGDFAFTIFPLMCVSNKKQQQEKLADNQNSISQVFWFVFLCLLIPFCPHHATLSSRPQEGHGSESPGLSDSVLQLPVSGLLQRGQNGEQRQPSQRPTVLLTVLRPHQGRSTRPVPQLLPSHRVEFFFINHQSTLRRQQSEAASPFCWHNTETALSCLFAAALIYKGNFISLIPSSLAICCKTTCVAVN